MRSPATARWKRSAHARGRRSGSGRPEGRLGRDLSSALGSGLCPGGWTGSLQQIEHGALRARDLLERALARRLVGPPADDASPVTEPVSSHVIVLDLDDQLGQERLPLGGALGAPPARAAG